MTGSASAVGNELTGNPLVRKLSFTGSTEIGRQLMQQCAKDIKKYRWSWAAMRRLSSLTMPILIKPWKARWHRSSVTLVKPASAPTACTCRTALYERFAEKLQQAVSKLHLGDGLQPDVTTGPLIDEKAVAKVQEHIADALDKGARIIAGGKPHAFGGNFFQPTILVDVPDNAKVAKEETFGPLAPLFRFKDEADVIAQANDTEFGLAAYFYARDLSRVFRVGEALEYGIVGINTGIISNEVAPFGG